MRETRPARSRAAFTLPAVLFLAVFSAYPLIQLIRMSVSSVSASTLRGTWQFIGLQNFTSQFSSGILTESIWRTLVFVLIVTIAGLAIGLAAAIALRSRGRTTAALLGLMVFVWALPPVVNGSVWKFLLSGDGLINTIITGIGLTHDPIPFLYDPKWALLSVALVTSWAVIPFNALVFRAAVLGISEEVFEAAKLDGATRWQEYRFILLPMIRPTTLILMVLTVVYGFRSFDYIYVMTFGGPGRATDTLPFLGYLQAFVQYNFGVGAATAVLTVALVLILAIVYARSIRKEEA